MSTSNELIILCAIVFTIFGISVLGAFCFDYWIKKCEKDPRKQIEPVELKYYWKHNEDLNQASEFCHFFFKSLKTNEITFSDIEELTDSWEEIEMKKKLKTKKKKRSQFRRKNKCKCLLVVVISRLFLCGTNFLESIINEFLFLKLIQYLV